MPLLLLGTGGLKMKIVYSCIWIFRYFGILSFSRHYNIYCVFSAFFPKFSVLRKEKRKFHRIQHENYHYFNSYSTILVSIIMEVASIQEGFGLSASEVAELRAAGR